MGDVRLFAVGIDELRDLFSGSPESAERIRSLASRAFPPTPAAAHARPTLLSRLGGPLTKHPANGPVVRPDVPTRADLENLLAGRHFAPDRIGAAWALVRLWLEDASWGTLTVGLDERRMDDIDFHLSSGGVESRYALRRLFNDRLALPVQHAPGQVTGYVRGSHALSMRDAYRAATSWLDAGHSAPLRDIADWLDGFDAWAERAPSAGRPAPDLVASFTV